MERLLSETIKEAEAMDAVTLGSFTVDMGSVSDIDDRVAYQVCK
jgi:hypothetical protein